MSFYFTIETDHPVTASAILDALDRDDVSVDAGDPSAMIFFIPGTSLRGVSVYVEDGSIDVGLNAFTPTEDARLAREITAAISWISGAPVLPEDSEDRFSAEQIAEYGGEGWLADRYREALFLAHRRDDADPDAPLAIYGYKRMFAVTPRMFEQEDTSREDAVRAVMQIGVDLQSIDDREDIQPSDLMRFDPPAPKPKSILSKLIGLTKPEDETDEVPYAAFVIAPDVRTLTPYNHTQDPLYVILSEDGETYFRITADVFFAYAEDSGARSYGAQVYDITIGSPDYAKLCKQGEPF